MTLVSAFVLFFIWWWIVNIIDQHLKVRSFQQRLTPGTHVKYTTTAFRWAYGEVISVHGHLINVQVGKQSQWVKRDDLWPLANYDRFPENFEQQ